MSKNNGNAIERLTYYYVNYIVKNHSDSYHIRRIVSWVPLILKGIDKLPGAAPECLRIRQASFSYKNKKFKARYNHKIGSRGGVEIIEVLPGPGSPDGKTVLEIKNFSDAEKCYNSFQNTINNFIKNTP